MRSCCFGLSDNGFALSADVLLSVFLITTFLSVAWVTQFSTHSISDLALSKELGRDALLALDESGFVVETFENSSLSDEQKMDLLAQKVRLWFPENFDFNLSVSFFDFNADQCRANGVFADCFPLRKDFSSRGNAVPSDASVGSEEASFFRKGVRMSCVIGGAPISFSQKPAVFPVPLDKPAFFSRPSESRLLLAGASDANLVVSVKTTPNTSVECDQDVRVDLNVSIVPSGRKPVDIVMVTDRSGSMSWDGHAALTDSYQVWLDSNNLLVADGSAGVRDLNIENPRMPLLLSSLGTSSARDIVKQGDYAFLANGANGFRILNVANPSAISGVSSISNVGTLNGVDVAGDYAFLAASNSGPIYRLTTTTSNNSSVRFGYSATESFAGQSFVATEGVLTGVELSLRRTGSPGSVTVHLRESILGPDIASQTVPASSVSNGSYSWVRFSFTIPVQVNPAQTYFTVVTTTGESTSNYFQAASRSSNPYPNGTAYQNSTALSGDLLYRTFLLPGIVVMDVSDKENPIITGNLGTIDPAKVVISGSNVFLSDGTAGLKIIDISNPLIPQLVGQLDSTDADGLAVLGSTVVVADHGSGVRVIDASVLSNPVLLGTFNTPGTAYDVAIDASNVFVADGTSLLVLDVSDPTSIQLLKRFLSVSTYRGIAYRENIVFIAADNQGLVTIDLSLGPRIDQVKAAGSAFLDFDLWKSSDQIGLISFNTSASLDEGLTTNFEDVNSSLYALLANGGTDIGIGISEGTTELISGVNQNPDAMKFQVVLSDGHSTSGNSVTAAQAAAANNVVIFTIAFGLDADQDELRQISTITGGQSYVAWDQNALIDLYALIAQEIGDIAAQSSTSRVQDAVVRIPIPSGSVITDSGTGTVVNLVDSNWIHFNVGDLNSSNRTWSSYFLLRFDCASEATCENEVVTFPQPISWIDYSDESGVPQPSVEWDSNIIIVLKYRDLSLSALRAIPSETGGILLDLNVFNKGFLSSPPSAIEIRVGNLYSGVVSQSFPVRAFSCGEKESGCTDHFELMMDLDSAASGNLFAVINPDRSIRECPNNNAVAINCASEGNSFYSIRLLIWQRSERP